jgi:hypothetical protein
VPDFQSDTQPMTPEEQQALIDSYEDTIGMQLEEEQPFLGEIRADEYVPGKYKGPQWHLAVLPLEFEVRGKTGMFHQYYNRSSQARSTMGAAVIGFKQNRIFGPSTRIGKGDLVGTVAWFVKRDLKFGRDRQTGQQIISEGVLIPIRAATAEEQALAGTVTPAVTGESATENGTAAAAPSSNLEWTSDQIDAVLNVIEGHATTEFQSLVIPKSGAGNKLARELKTAILSGAALRYLTANKYADMVDGKVARGEAALAF